MPHAAAEHLDAEELLHIALTASRQGKNEEAIIGLKRALQLAPNDARLHYYLGVEYTHIGFLERAAAHLHQTLQLNPSLDGARFQLGFLYLNAGQTDAAAEIWKELDRLGTQHPLYLFKAGLLHLAKNELEECEDCLRRGIALNSSNATLNHDMARILKGVQTRLAVIARAAEKRDADSPSTETTTKRDEKPEPASTPSPPASRSPKPVTPKGAAAAYRQNTQDTKDK